MIKRCIYLQYKSSNAYEALRSSGVIELPLGRTLCNYKRLEPSVVGHSDEHDKQLLDLAEKTGVLNKYVEILANETYEKE